MSTTNSDTGKGAAPRAPADRHLPNADAITIKATIADPHIDQALISYGLTPDSEIQRHIYFFDTPDLDLFKSGIVARARRISGGHHDSTIIFDPVIPTEVPARWRECRGFELEADGSEAALARLSSLTRPVAKGLIKQVVTGEKGVAKLFTNDQDAFLAAMGGRPIDYAVLRVLGPVAGQCWAFEHPGCPWPITAERWQRDDGARLMEVAIRVPLAQAEFAMAGFRAFVSAVAAEQRVKPRAKTLWALEHFAKALLMDDATQPTGE